MLCLLLGLGIAIAVFTFPKAAAICLGISFGFVVANLVYNILVKFVTTVDPDYLYLGLIISFVVISVIVGGLLETYIIIFSTTLVGAYALIRGISILVGNYPDENYVLLLINKGEYTQLSRVYGTQIYYYFAAMVTMAIVGFFVQYNFFKQKFEDEREQSHK